ncbi:unnamed protein product [Ambrosiozyma monospora]|uniref:Unnamed protein product n=1 Tax=Ambrosiozyma monospora TaxID=43982 RepID=A0ACB5T496_AMBMO|nr:unnamed protein product [Ambrosiozyma monospora]
MTDHKMRSKLSSIKDSQKRTLEKVYGDEAKRLFFKAGQVILVKECRIVASLFGLDHDLYKRYVKLYWILFLTGREKFFNITHLISILYFALLRMKASVYLVDLLALARAEELPNERCDILLPIEIKAKLEIRVISLLTNRRRSLFEQSSNVFKHTKLIGDFQNYNLNYYPLMVRIVIQLNLPLEILLITKNMIDANEVKFTFSELSKGAIFHPEVKLYALLVQMTRFFFHVNPGMYRRWICIYNEYKDKSAALNSQVNPHNALSMLYNETTVDQLLGWSDSKTEEYLKMFTQNYLPLSTSIENFSTNQARSKANSYISRKVSDIFPLDESLKHGSYDDDLKKWKVHLIEAYTKLYSHHQGLHDDELLSNLDSDLKPVNSDTQDTELLDILVMKFRTDTGLKFFQIDKALADADKLFYRCLNKSGKSSRVGTRSDGLDEGANDGGLANVNDQDNGNDDGEDGAEI